MSLLSREEASAEVEAVESANEVTGVGEVPWCEIVRAQGPKALGCREKKCTRDC